MSFIDNIVGFFSPRAAFEREKFRLAKKMASDAYRKFEAASYGRRTKNWHATSTSADAENETAIETLRNRSRDMSRNNPYAKKAIRVIANNVIGTGIRPSVYAEGRVEKKIKEVWRMWAERTACDYDGLRNIYGIQRKVMKTVAEAGECIVVMRRSKSKGDILPVQLQVLEPDFIDTRKDNLKTVGKGWIKQGIEYDANGRRVAYWIYKEHPGDYYLTDTESQRIPISDICHIYEDDRPGQTRGIPFGHASMTRLRDFDEFEDAELIKQKVAACFSAFITTDGGANGLPGENPASGDEAPERLEPGMITTLRAGEKIDFGEPPTFNGYGDYSKKVLSGIAAGYGITYEALTGDLSNVNFSSGRMGWLEFQRNVHDWQQMVISQFCEKAWGWFMMAMELKGNVRKFHDADWTLPRREMIDPSKEVKGIIMAIRSGLISPQEAIRQQGYDPEEVVRQIKVFYDLLDEGDVILDIDGRNTTQGGQPVSKGEPKEEDEDDEQEAARELIRAIRGE